MFYYYIYENNIWILVSESKYNSYKGIKQISPKRLSEDKTFHDNVTEKIVVEEVTPHELFIRRR